MGAPALAAIGADATAVCAARLARVAGTHALLLDGMAMPSPPVAGVGRWTPLRPSADGNGWLGPLRADADALPFEGESFCAVLVRFAPHPGFTPESVVSELARVLAPHGMLLIADLHPRSLWHAGIAPGRWERALRGAGLEVSAATRCGSPWPRPRGAAGMPHWLVRGMGGAWVIEAHPHAQAAIPLRKPGAGRRAVEHKTLLPGAQRKPLNSLLRSTVSAPAVLARLTHWHARSAGCADSRHPCRSPFGLPAAFASATLPMQSASRNPPSLLAPPSVLALRTGCGVQIGRPANLVATVLQRLLRRRA
ncbi:MAG: class I SAM-dependent methyltransferase [Rhodanobacteraceae bacterium]